MFQFKRILKYLFNGSITTVTQFSVLTVGVEIFGMDPFYMSVIAFICSLCVGFTLHRFITFGRKDTEKIGRQFMLVSSMAVTNLIFNTVAMYLLLNMGVHYLVAQFFVTGMIVIWTYIGYNFIFKQKSID